MSQTGNGKRVAIVYGLRTPFAESGTVFGNMTPLDLGRIAVVELLNRTEIDPSGVGSLVFANVMPAVRTPNLAREVALSAGLPHGVPAFTVSSSCASSCQAFTNAVDSILAGVCDTVIAGGAESSPENPYLFSPGRRSSLYDASRGINLIEKARPFLGMGAHDTEPALAVMPERYSGIVTGEAAERLAREHKISREEQDAYALRSHTLASRAQEEGIFEDEIIRTFVPPAFREAVTKDNSIKTDISEDSLSALPPLFDREFGTVTAGNSAPFSDGAGAMLLMDAEKAKALGYKPLAYVKSYAYAAADPDRELLMSAAYSTPKALERAGITLDDVDLIEMHEAFAAQVIASLKALSSKSFAKEKLGRSHPVGDIDMEKLNVSGGTLALGHPLGATGCRLITTLAYRMAKRKGQFGLVTLGAAGGLGVSIVLEKE